MQASAIKLILSDIDGTIMPAGASTVSPRTVAAFRAALDSGIMAGPASGRGLVQIAPFFRGDAACCQTAIATNGLEVYCAGEKICEHRLPIAALERALDIVRDTPGAGLLAFDGTTPQLVAGDRDVLARITPAYACACVPADALLAEDVLKANIFIDADMAGTEAFVARLNDGVDGLDFDIPMVGYANIMPTGWNKGSALLTLCDHLGITPDQVVVFGDAGNDLTMFSVAGHAVAVGNATPEAKAAARWHIGRCEDDAVAAAIEALAAGEWPFSE